MCRRLIYRLIYKVFFVIFVHYNENLEEFVKIYGYREKVIPIPHGNEDFFLRNIESEKELHAIGSKLGVPRDAKVILFFGSIANYKGIEYLLEAFQRVNKALPEAFLIVAGYPEDSVDVDLLRHSANSLGIDRALCFYLKYVEGDEVALLFHLASVVVFPYIKIYQSGALQLAYSFGKPVVATDLGGFREVVENGRSGLLVPPADAPGLAEAILKLLKDSALARRCGQRGRELSLTRYSWSHVAQRIHEAYVQAEIRTEAIS
jgi:glycosyltransferase involved in cell wall biosynthesis